jgi:hypothetical protein
LGGGGIVAAQFARPKAAISKAKPMIRFPSCFILSSPPVLIHYYASVKNHHYHLILLDLEKQKWLLIIFGN